MSDVLTAMVVPLISNSEQKSGLNKDLIDTKIKWEDTRLMFEKYRAHDKSLRIPTGVSSSDTLRGFRIPRMQIKNIIDQAECSGVMIMFAVRQNDIGAPMSAQFFTIVVAGIDSNNNLMTQDNVYDYCDPCPKNCPDDDSGIFH